MRAEARSAEVTCFGDTEPRFMVMLLVEGEYITDTDQPEHAALLERIAAKLNETNDKHEEKD
jgi:hypothetical protein